MLSHLGTLTSQNEVEMTVNELYSKLVAHTNQQTKLIKDEIHESVNEISNKVVGIQRKLQETNDRCLHFERVIRKNNVMIFGLNTNPDDGFLQKTLDTLNQYLETDILASDINNIRRIGKGQKQPVILEFISYLKKVSLFKNVGNLKGTGIGIAHDLCKEDREKNKILVKYLRKARSESSKANIKGDKLYIEGKPYTADELQNAEGEFISESEDGNSELSAASTEVTAVNRTLCSSQPADRQEKGKIQKTGPPNPKITLTTRSKRHQK